jgi:hypothetical protein
LSEISPMIYGSTYNQFVNATVDEITAASQVCDMLEYLFINSGYGGMTINAFDEGTTKQNILNNAYSMDRNYDNVAVFYFGHYYNTDHYMDNDGNDVSYSDIQSQTTGSTVFAWSWVCRSAEDYDSGLPVAWTQEYCMSPNGYSNPYGSHCYIGFSGASPTLSAGSFDEYPGDLAMDFITYSYYYALEYDDSIRDALNSASYAVFSESYLEGPLTDYRTWWPFTDWPGPEYYGWQSGQMRVYGNSNIHLRPWSPPPPQTELWIDALDNWELGAVNVWVDNQWVCNTNYNYWEMPISPGYHTIEVDPYASSGAFSYFIVDNDEVYENPITVYFPPGETTYLVAYYFP